jgi:hypothetical protein
LLRVERLYLFGDGLGRRRGLADVALNRPPPHGLVEGAVQHGVDLPDRARSQPGVQLALVKGLDVIGCKGFELAPPELRLDVAAGQALVALECRGLDRTLDRALQPSRKSESFLSPPLKTRPLLRSPSSSASLSARFWRFSPFFP